MIAFILYEFISGFIIGFVCYRAALKSGVNHTQKQCLALSDRIDECLKRGQIDRNEIQRWRARLTYIGSSQHNARKFKEQYERAFHVTRTTTD